MFMDEQQNKENNSTPIETNTLRIGRKEIIENIISLVFIVGVIFVASFFFDVEGIKKIIESGGVWAPAVFVLAKASTLIFAPISGSFLYPLGGALFGFSKGFTLLLLGDALGGIVSFYISRVFGRKVVERFVKADNTLVARALELAGTPKGFLIVRICFAALPEITSYAAGLTRLNFLPFIIIFMSVGAIPTALLSYSGSLLFGFENKFLLIAVMGLSVVGVVVGFILFNWWVRRAKVIK